MVARLQDPEALVRRRVAWAIGEIAVRSADAGE
jgi:HEAT repeat protein